MSSKRKHKLLPPEDELFIQLTSELTKESDRALAVIAAAYLDHLLEILIANEFKLASDAERDNLFKFPAGMLHSFAFKTRFAHMTGLITNDQKQDLNTIRDIRNGFAHELIGMSFDTKEIAKSCNKLVLAQVGGKPSTAREQYKKAAVRLMVDLIVRSNHTKEGKND